MKCVQISQQIIMHSKEDAINFKSNFRELGYLDFSPILNKDDDRDGVYFNIKNDGLVFVLITYPTKQDKTVFHLKLMSDKLESNPSNHLFNYHQVQTAHFAKEYNRILGNISHNSEYAEMTFVKEIERGLTAEQDMDYLVEFLETKQFDKGKLSEFNLIVATPDKQKNVFAINPKILEVDNYSTKLTFSGLLFNKDSFLSPVFTEKYASRFTSLLNSK